jgi:amidase
VEEAQPNIDGRALANSYFAMYYGEVAADIEDLESILGRKAKPGDVEPETWALALLGRTFSAGYFVRALREWGIASREMGRFHETYDLYLTPTMAVPPYKIGELQPNPIEKFATRLINTLGLGRLLKSSGVFEKIAIQSLSKTPFTQIANLTGQPAMSLPLSWTADGLPCGVHLIGRFGDEATLIRLASQLEKEMPWFDKRPPEIS